MKKIISILLCAVLFFSALPMACFAQDDVSEPETSTVEAQIDLLPTIYFLPVQHSTITYKESVLVHAKYNYLGPLDEIEWTVQGGGMDVEKLICSAHENCQCVKLTSKSNGTVTLSARIIAADHVEWSRTDSVTITSKAGFWQKFAAFFKYLFHAPEVYSQVIDILF